MWLPPERPVLVVKEQADSAWGLGGGGMEAGYPKGFKGAAEHHLHVASMLLSGGQVRPVQGAVDEDDGGEAAGEERDAPAAAMVSRNAGSRARR